MVFAFSRDGARPLFTGIALEVLTVALPDCYVEHGNVEVLKKELHVDAESVAKRIIAAL